MLQESAVRPFKCTFESRIGPILTTGYCASNGSCLGFSVSSGTSIRLLLVLLDLASFSRCVWLLLLLSGAMPHSNSGEQHCHDCTMSIQTSSGYNMYSMVSTPLWLSHSLHVFLPMYVCMYACMHARMHACVSACRWVGRCPW